MRFFLWIGISAIAVLISSGSSEAALTKMLGFSETKILYTQDQVQGLNYWLHTLKGGLEVSKEGSRWAFGVSGYASLSPSFTYPGATSSLKFYGLNVRASYNLLVKKRFQLSLAGGYYFLTSIAQDYAGGFENINGPQIYPSFRFKLKKRGTFTGYAKYSPVSSKFSLLSIDQSYEIAFGLAYFFKQQWFSFSPGIAIDFSSVSLVDPNGFRSSLKTGSAGLIFVFGGQMRD